MTPRSRWAVGLLLLTALVAAPPQISGQEAEPFLHGPLGPYRGRVVELLTERPLQGALVIIAWEFDPHNDGGRTIFAFREILTDAAGQFVVEASAIETTPPPRTYPPRVLVYTPGYVTFPRERGRRFGRPAARFAGAGDVVALKPVRDAEERIEALNTFIASLERLPGRPPDAPSTESTRLMLEELAHFGIHPVPDPARPGDKP